MLVRSEPFTEVNRLAQQLFGAPSTGTWSRPTAMPADAYRNGDERPYGKTTATPSCSATTGRLPPSSGISDSP